MINELFQEKRSGVSLMTQTKELRWQKDDKGNIWFVANDIAEMLGYGNPREALSKHVDTEDVTKRDTLTDGGTQEMNYINESGMYALIFGSQKEEARKFKRWVTGEVLPSIRREGYYGQAVEQIKNRDKEIREALINGFWMKGEARRCEDELGLRRGVIAEMKKGRLVRMEKVVLVLGWLREREKTLVGYLN